MKKAFVFIILFASYLLAGPSWQKIGTGVATSPLPSGLVAHYKYDGDFSDSIANAGSTVSNVSFTTGRFGPAAFFNGTNAYIQSTLPISTSSTSYTISIWLKPNAQSYVLGSSSASGDGKMYAGFSGGSFIFGGNSGATSALTCALTLPTNTFTHLVITKNSTTYNSSLWVNGNLYCNGTMGVQNSSNELFVGRVNTYYFSGAIDQVRIYNRILDQTEINQLYNEAGY